MQSKQGKMFNYFSPAKNLDPKRQRNEEEGLEPEAKRTRVLVDEDAPTQSSQVPLSQQSQQEVESLLAELDAAPEMLDDNFDAYIFKSSQNKTNQSNNSFINRNNNQNSFQSNNRNQPNNTNNTNGNQSKPFQNNQNKNNANNAQNKTPTKAQKQTKIEKSVTPSKPAKEKEPEKSDFLEKIDRNGKLEARYNFLADLRDAQRRPITDPDYDPSTLFIPNSEYVRLTQFERQYWDIKRKFFDTVIFFKKGKFYELYESDADIGHKHLDLKMTDRVNMRMVGVPENFFAHWASKLLQLGYKVAKVDELESGLGKQMRQAKEGGAKRSESGTRDVIRRELACVLTAGTLTDNSLVPSHAPHYLLVLQESSTSYGFVLLDAAGGIFHLGQFSEDARFTELETLLLQTTPKEIIYPKGLSPGALVLVRRMITLHKIQTQSVASDYFGTASDTLRALTIGGYFKDGEIPETLKQALESLGGIDSAVLPLEALGACLKYLQSLKQDETILGGAEFRAYSVSAGSNLILDGATLQNLEILANSTDGGPRGSLLALLDQCSTAFGRRLFRSWLIRPLFSIAAINERLDAVEDLHSSSDLLDTLPNAFGKLPDLERSVARIKSKTCKLGEFLSCLRGFEMAWDCVNLHLTPEVREQFTSPLLRSACTLPDLEPCLEAMHSYFNWDEARDSGSVTPQRGLDPKLDEAIDTVQNLLDKLAACLKEAKTIMRCNVEYKDIGKERYQIEIPVDAIKRKKEGVPKEWSLMSQTKSVKRYHTPMISSLLKPLAEAEYTADVLKKEILKELQNKFNEYSEQWDGAVKCLATIDSLLSLAKVSGRAGNTMCRPIFVTSETQKDRSANGNLISLTQSIHPCVVPPSGGDVVPNDIKLGDGAASVMVITGPNMGGKSTLLRQTCITVIMAQMGCFVPASSCVLTPVDRIFTRLGARDDIVTGQSTFMVELQETGNMLNNATSSSLVILDELGRGTSTFDGYAIAYSVLAHLATTIQCRTMFSTHYHSLTEEVGRLPSVGVFHMDSIVDEEKREVAFLYRLTEGNCPRSYGLHVANMASIPQSILDEAQNIADTLHGAILHKLAKKIYDSVTEGSGNFEQLVGLWRAAKGRWISWKESA